MKGFGRLLLALSAGFCVFSIYYGIEYGELDEEYAGVDMRRELVDLAEEETLLLVKAVSIPYFLLCLGFFASLARKGRRRIVSVTAVIVCLVMIVWSLLLSQAISFDEVFPAWVVAAIILAGLLLAVLRERAEEVAAAS